MIISLPLRRIERAAFGSQVSLAKEATRGLGTDAATAFATAARKIFFAGGANGFAFLTDSLRNQKWAARDHGAGNARGGGGEVAGLAW